MNGGGTIALKDMILLSEMEKSNLCTPTLCIELKQSLLTLWHLHGASLGPAHTPLCVEHVARHETMMEEQCCTCLERAIQVLVHLGNRINAYLEDHKPS